MGNKTNAGDPTTTPLISIVIPVYNTQRYLSECLDSALAQTYNNIEIICIDDGSTDESLATLKKYSLNDRRVRVYSQKNTGVVTARNNAISKAKGIYILPLDSDDKIAPNCIEKLLHTIEETSCAVASPGVEFFDAQTGRFLLPKPTEQNMALQNCIVNCALFEKKYWEEYGGFDTRFANGVEDYDFWWNFIQDGKKIVRTHEILFYYRMRSGEDSRTQETGHHHSDLIRIMQQKYPLMRKLSQPSVTQRIWRFGLRVLRYGQRKGLKAAKYATRSNRVFEWRQYKNYVLNQQLDNRDFVTIATKKYSEKKPKKLIAYYLPQFYQIPQNDEWYGRGFTEWSNAAKAVPQFTGHWQPHLPIDVGFYNLETTQIMHRQVELAKMYGIYGFCFYYYWFSGGEKIMEKPINNWLDDKSLNFPFMLFWANEDWTNTWGESADIGTKIYSAKMKPKDVKIFVDDIIPFFKDERYITIDGRPHVIIYQARKDLFLPEFIKRIGDEIEKRGVNRPYISLVFPDESPETFDPREYGADAAVEFGAHMKVRPDYIQKPMSDRKIINPEAKITMYDMNDYVKNRSFNYKTEFPVHRGAMTTFDNTARKIYSGAYLFSLTPSLYKEWLSELIKSSQTDYVFISTWNEWAEGMHLEPDQRYGYAYLQATKDALLENTD